MREESGGNGNPCDPKSSLLSRARFVNSWDCEVDKCSSCHAATRDRWQRSTLAGTCRAPRVGCKIVCAERKFCRRCGWRSSPNTSAHLSSSYVQRESRRELVVRPQHARKCRVIGWSNACGDPVVSSCAHGTTSDESIEARIDQEHVYVHVLLSGRRQRSIRGLWRLLLCTHVCSSMEVTECNLVWSGWRRCELQHQVAVGIRTAMKHNPKRQLHRGSLGQPRGQNHF